MEREPGYKKLVVWKNARELRKKVYEITKRFPTSEMRRISQMRDSARSVKQNIQEGYSKNSLGDYIRSLEISKGSLAELTGDIEDCGEDQLINDTESKELGSLCKRTHYLFDRLLTALYSKKQSGTWKKRWSPAKAFSLLFLPFSSLFFPLLPSYSGQLSFDGVPVDITTTANEDLVIAPGEGGNTQIGDASGTNTNATSNDDLHITGILEVDGATYLDGALTLTGALTLAGNVTLGDASSDTITTTGRFNSHLVPSADATYDLGSTSLAWRTLYIGTVSSITGFDLALAPISGKALTGTVTRSAATGNEVLYDLAGTVNKATSGNYTGLKLNVTETSAPGTADKLLDLQKGGTSHVQVYNDTLSANYGMLSVGTDDWDGSTSGFFAGSSSGTIYAGNAISGFAGNLIDLQVAGTSKFKVDSTGAITSTGNQTNSGNLTITGNLSVNGNTTLGDASGDSVTSNAATWTLANDTAVTLSGGVDGINFDANTLSIDATNNRVGIGTNAPGAALHVTGECVTGDTLLPIIRMMDDGSWIMEREEKDGEGQFRRLEDISRIPPGRKDDLQNHEEISKRRIVQSDKPSEESRYLDIAQHSRGTREDEPGRESAIPFNSERVDLRDFGRSGNSARGAISDKRRKAANQSEDLSASSPTQQSHPISQALDSSIIHHPSSIIQYIPITDVLPGDRVLSLNEATGKLEFHRINGLLDKGIHPVFKLTTASGRYIKTTGNHPYLVKREEEGRRGKKREEEGNTEWVRAADLKVGQEIAAAGGELVLEKGEENSGQNAHDRSELAYPENKHPFNEIRSDAVQFNPKFFDFFGKSLFKALLNYFNRSVFGSFLNLVEEVHQSLGARVAKLVFQYAGNRDNGHNHSSGYAKVYHLFATLSNRLGGRSAYAAAPAPVIASAEGAKQSLFSSQLPAPSSKPDVPSSDILWDPIVSIEYTGLEHVYDIEVEGTHNFVAGHFVAEPQKDHGSWIVDHGKADRERRVFKLVLEDGRLIRTTGNCPYLVRTSNLSRSNSTSLPANWSHLMSRPLTFSSASSFMRSEKDEPFASGDLSRVVESGLDVRLSEGREVFQDFFRLFTGGEHFQDLPDHDAGSFESGLSVADLGVGDDMAVELDALHGTPDDTTNFVPMEEQGLRRIRVADLKVGQEIAVTSADLKGTAFVKIARIVMAAPQKDHGTIPSSIIHHPSSSSENVVFGGIIAHNTYLASASGNVGIGTTSPQSWAKLDVVGGDVSVQGGSTTVGGTAVSVITSEAGAKSLLLKAREGANPDLVISTTGNVGIGTTGPTKKLQVTGATNKSIGLGTSGTLSGIFTDATNPSAALEFSRASDGVFDSFLANYETTSNAKSVLAVYGRDELALGSEGREVVRINTSGNVGIGTTSPQNAFQVLKTGSSWTRVADFYNTTASSRPYIEVGYSATDGGITMGYINNAGLTANYGFISHTGLDPSAGQGIILKSDGNVGIGTTSPGMLLDISKNQAAQTAARVINTTAGGEADLIASNGTYTTNVGVYGSSLSYGALANNQSFLYSNSNAGLTLMADQASGVIKFATGGNSEKARIDASGNVGIGTTSPTAQLELSTDSAKKPTTNTWTIASDARIKTDIRPYADGLATIQGIRPIWYQYNGKGGFKADGKEHIGVIAQEMQPIAPYTIDEYQAKLSPEDAEETTLLEFNSHALTFTLINAVKEQQKEIEELKARLAELEAGGKK